MMASQSLSALVSIVMVLSACGGKQQRAATTPSADAAVDTASASAAPTKARADSAKPAPKDYDRALKPRFKVDEKTGKIDTLRRPPQEE
jgi:hypothetical protein